MASPHIMETYARLPVAFTRGEGVWLWDRDGKRYLDAVAGVAVNAIGHCHPKLVAALRERPTACAACSWVRPNSRIKIGRAHV